MTGTIADSVDLFGKVASDLSTDLVVGKHGITGTLKYVTGYTGFSGLPEEQKGNFLAIKSTAADADSITVQLVGGKKPEVTLDEDGICVLQVANNVQSVRVKAYVDGKVAKAATYSLTGLVLANS